MPLTSLKVHKSKILFNRITEGAFLKAQKERYFIGGKLHGRRREKMATSSSREERRKRILDRGSDRLALISGRIQSLPSSPISSPHHHRAATTHLSTQSLVFTRDHHDHLQSLLSNQSNGDLTSILYFISVT